MAEAGRLSHTDLDGSTMEGRVQAAGYGGWTALGEVVAAGLASPETVVAHLAGQIPSTVPAFWTRPTGSSGPVTIT